MATTGPEVVAELTITLEQAEALLAKDVGSAAACVNNVVAVQLSQEEFDALVDFVFNLGAGSFEGSTLLRDLNAADFASAAAQFDAWDHAGGAVVAGLLRRPPGGNRAFSVRGKPARRSPGPGFRGNSERRLYSGKQQNEETRLCPKRRSP